MLGKMIKFQFIVIKIILHGNLLYIKHQDSTIHILAEMLIFAFLHIHFKEKLNHIHSSLVEKFSTGMKPMENYHQSIHLKFLMQMIDLFNTVILLKNSLKNNVKLEGFQ
jgi:hypothetical protein